MRVKIENLGDGAFVIKDRWGDMHEVYPGEEVIVTGPTQGHLLDDKPSSYRCTPLT